MRRRSINFNAVQSGFGSGFKRFSAVMIVLSTLVFSLPADALVPLRTVTFFEQANALDFVSSFETATVPSALTGFSSLSPTFSNSGHTFLSWNTSANGSGTTYLDGSTYSFAGDLSLYAQWTALPVVHSVTFFENSSTIDALSEYLASATTLQLTAFSSLNPIFVNAGHTFVGWSTSATGGATTYTDGAIYGFGADLSLYAQWAVIPVSTATFVAGGDTGFVPPLSGPTGITITLPNISGVTFLGHSFVGWNSASNASGTLFAANSQYALSGNVTLYAQWTPEIYKISYSPSGGSVTPVEVSYAYGSTALTLPAPTSAGAVFNGWFSTPTGGTLVGLAGAQWTPSGSVTLFAEWTSTLNDTLTFDTNGGSGSVSSITASHGSTITLPDQTGILHAGFKLIHWNSSAQGKGTSFGVGQTMILTGSLTLYAQWSGHAPALLVGAVGSFAKNSAALSNGLKGQVRRLASIIKSRKYLEVRLYGYTASTGLVSLNFSLSRTRAAVVANYLRGQLRTLKVRGITVRSAGEGSIGADTSRSHSRVEVFVL